jgi:hypothetical protein
VKVQLKTLTAVGIATRNVSAEKIMLASSPWLVNMWWPQTRNEIAAIARDENATARYPKIFLRAWTARVSLMIAIPGRIMMYTAGWL